MTLRPLTHLQALEAEAIHIMREVAAELEKPVLLFSGGKDSIVLLRLAEKAFWPGKFPFPLMHVDTGHNFPEAIEYRDRRVAELGARLIVAPVQDSIDHGRVVDETGPRRSRNRLQTITLLDAIERARLRRRVRRRPPRRGARPREGARLLLPRRLRPVGSQGPAARALEPLQRPDQEGRARARVPDLELDRARRLGVHPAEGIELPSIYFAHEREVFERDGMLYAASDYIELHGRRGGVHGIGPLPHGRRHDLHRRGRSTAATLDDVVAEIAATRITERGETRADDRATEAAMEDRKREGYF